MIYLFTGDDTKTKGASYDKFLKSLVLGTEVLSITRNDFDRNQIESFYSSSGLFSAKSVIVFQNILDREETRDFILEKLELMGEADNTFVFLEGKLLKGTIDSFKKARAEIGIFELPKEKKEKFNNFLLATAFADKDKLNLWIYFRQAVNLGVGLEELVGVLFWKAKDMILKKSFGKYSMEEVQNFASRLSYLLPEARKNGPDAELAMEQFLLEVF